MTTLIPPPFDIMEYVEVFQGAFRLKPDIPSDIRKQIEEYQKKVNRTFVSSHS